MKEEPIDRSLVHPDGVLVTPENIESIREQVACDHRVGLKPGCVTWSITYVTANTHSVGYWNHGTMTYWPNGRGAVAYGADSIWGEWGEDGLHADDPDAGIISVYGDVRHMHTLRLEGDEPGISGWYVSDERSLYRDEAEIWGWCDRGNGPELLNNDDVHGPFRTEAEAKKWMKRHWADEMIEGRRERADA